MGTEILLYAGIILAGFSVMWTVYTIFSVNEDNKALSWATGDQPDKSESPIINWSRPLVHQLTLKYAKRIKNESFRKNIEYKIMTGGLENELNVDEFIGLKLLWGVFFPVLIGILNVSLTLGYPWFVIVLAMPFGFMIPDFHANKQRKTRYQSIVIDLPFFVDLLALSTQAGADFRAMLRQMVRTTPMANTILYTLKASTCPGKISPMSGLVLVCKKVSAPPHRADTAKHSP